jgi:hypothetical protein
MQKGNKCRNCLFWEILKIKDSTQGNCRNKKMINKINFGIEDTIKTDKMFGCIFHVSKIIAEKNEKN